MTKDVAHQIAIKLTEEKAKSVEQLHLDYKEYITQAYISQIPESVLEAFKQHPDWFYTPSAIQFNGNGFNWENVYATTPIICNGGTSANLTLTEAIAKKAMKLKNKWMDENKKLKDLNCKIEVALFGLRTYAQIEKNLPEAVPYLPKQTSMELMVNFDTLRKEIKKASN